MGTAFSLEGKLNLPGTPGLPLDPIPYAILASYDSKSEFEYLLPSSTGTKSVDFGTMPTEGPKAMLVVYEANSSSPVIAITLNGGDEPVELSPGGFLAFASPVPVDGLTSLSIAYTGPGRVRVWLLG